jgi:hypothetical protein
MEREWTSRPRMPKIKVAASQTKIEGEWLG